MRRIFNEPMRIFLKIVLSVLICEAVVMFFLHIFDYGEILHIIIDPLILVTMASPLIFIFVIMPLRSTLNQLQQAKDALAESKKIAEDANDAKSAFLANVSHEIRTSAAVIIGFSDELLENERRPEIVKSVEVIKRNGTHLLAYLNDILDLSKVEAGKLEIEKIVFSPTALLEEVIASFRISASVKNNSVDLQLDDQFPTVIHSDPARLRQILYNIVGNAIKFSKDSTITILGGMHNSNGGEPELQFEIRDHGIGMAEEQAARLFRPFEQARVSTSRKYGGTGLGLAITQKLVQLLGGSISINSTLGSGTTVRVSFRASSIDVINTGDEKYVLAAIKRAAKNGRNADVRQVSSSCRALLADDSEDNRYIVRRIIESTGDTVSEAFSGKEAMTLARSAKQQGRPYDYIILDIQMPELDGFQTVQELRRDGHSETIIALTANADRATKEQCVECGFDCCFQKPFDRRKLSDIHKLRDELTIRG